MGIFVNLGAFVSSWQKKMIPATKALRHDPDSYRDTKEEEMDLISKISQLN